MSLKTIVLHVYQIINTQHTVGGEVFTSPINSITYGYFLSKLFIVSILGTRLLGQKKILFPRTEYGSPSNCLFKGTMTDCSKGL